MFHLRFSSIFIYIVSLIGSFSCIGQTQIKGLILTDEKKPASGVNISLLKKDSSSLEYTFSLPDGSFFISSNYRGDALLIFNSLTHLDSLIHLNMQGDEIIEVSVVLKEKITQLDEIIVFEEKPIEKRKDTIVFNVKAFLKGNENVVEDILKNIPGLEVTSDGAIKVNGKEVEKVMVEGDDFFSGGYRILTKSMPAQPIDQVEVINNFSENRLLGKIEQSDLVALNLKLDENAKRIWFGSSKLAHSVDDQLRKEGSLNVMNFGKVNKYYSVASINNIGNNPSGGFDFLVKPKSKARPNSFIDNYAYEILEIIKDPILFEENRYVLNNAKLGSANAIFNPNKNLKINSGVLINFDQNLFFRKKIEDFNSSIISFQNTEDYAWQREVNNLFGKIDATLNLTNTQQIRWNTSIGLKKHDTETQLVFNDSFTSETLNTKDYLAQSNITYTNQLSPKSALVISTDLKYNQLPQNYSLNDYLTPSLFPNDSIVNAVKQSAQNDAINFNLEGHVLRRDKSNNLFEFLVGFTQRRDDFNSGFFMIEKDSNISTPNDYQNQLSYILSDFYIQSKYLHSWSRLTLSGDVSAHQLFTNYTTTEGRSISDFFFVNPRITIEFDISNNDYLQLSAANRTRPAMLRDIFPNYVLSNYRDFQRGTNEVNILNYSSFILFYQLGDWTDEFIGNFSLQYNRTHDYFTSYREIQRTYSQSRRIVLSNGEAFNFTSKLDRYIRLLKSNLRLKLYGGGIRYQNVINEMILRDITSSNYGTGIELRTALKGLINYNIGSDIQENKISTTNERWANAKSFLDIYFRFSSNTDLQISTEHYYFPQLKNTKNHFTFIDIRLTHKPKSDKLKLYATLSNLLNEKTYSDFFTSDVSLISREYTLLQRYFLAGLEYRF